MSTDTENAEQDKSFGSSRTRRRRENSDKSQKKLQGSSRRGREADVQPQVEPKLSSLDFLLSVLQSDLGEIRDAGGSVRFFDDPNGLIIQLPNVAICKTHKMMRFGPRCPIC